MGRTEGQDGVSRQQKEQGFGLCFMVVVLGCRAWHVRRTGICLEVLRIYIYKAGAHAGITRRSWVPGPLIRGLRF